MAGITFQEIVDQYGGSSPNTIPMAVACAPKTDLLLAFAALQSYQFWADVSVADDVNGAYTPLCLYWDPNYAGGCAVCVFSCASTGTGTPNVTFTWDGGYYGGNCAVLHYNGFVNGAVLDVNTLVAGTPANGNSAIAAAGPYTTTNANEVLVAMLVNGGWSYNPTNPPGWSWRNADGDMVIYDSIVSSIQTGQSLSGTMSGTNPKYWDLPLFSFYDGPGGGAVYQPLRHQRAAPQVADLSLRAFYDAPRPSRQGRVPPKTSVQPQLVDLSLQPRVWTPMLRPQGRPPRTIIAAPQNDPTQIRPVVFQVATTPVVTYKSPGYFKTVPQIVDLTLQSFFDAPLPAAQGVLGTQVLAYPTDPTQVAARVWSSQPAALVITNPVAPYYSLAPQLVDLSLQPRLSSPMLTQQGFSVRSYVVNAPLIDLTILAYIETPQPSAQGILGARHSAYPVDPTQIQPQVFASLRAFIPIPNPVSPFYALVPQLLDTTQQPQIWKPGLVRQGILGAVVSAAPTDTSQLKPQVWASLVPPPVIPNPTAPYYRTVPQTVDLTLAAQIRSPLLRPQGAVPPHIRAGQQTLDLTPASQFYPPYFSPTVITHGPTVRQHQFTPGQPDTSVNPTQVWAAVGAFVYTIDGANQKVIGSAYGSITVYSDGNANFYTIQ